MSSDDDFGPREALKLWDDLHSPQAFDYSQLPTAQAEALARYIEHGYQPGNFLTAVLSNDLKEAVNRADEINLWMLPTYVRWLYNHAPYSCWGSPEQVETWIAERRRADRQRESER